ncbi:MAG: alpha/beta hydrolase-fold protein [Flavobacteriaceae bacterium]
MKKTIITSMILSFGLSFGQTYESEIFEHNKKTLPYRILLPENFNPENAYPLLMILHGAGERGDDNVSQLFHGGKLFQSDSFRSKYPAIVVFPQCPKGSYWANVLRDYDQPLDQKYTYSEQLPKNPQLEIVEALLLNLEEQYRIDSSRRYIGGLSMGGMGTFELVSRNPDYFAAAFPICGGGNPEWAKYLSKTPLWIFHGEQDDVVSVNFSKAMFQSLKKINAPVKLTLYPEVYHDSWHNAFGDPDLMNWLFSHQKR